MNYLVRSTLTVALAAGSFVAFCQSPEVTWPVNYSVFQRNTTSTGGSASVSFTGQLYSASNAVASYRIVKLSERGATGSNLLSGNIPPGSFSQIGSAKARRFYFSLTIPTGWYNLTINDGNKKTTTVKFGVGEVFFLAGQSNVQGAGATSYITNQDNLDCVVSLKVSQGGLTPYQTIVRPVMGPLNAVNPAIGPTGDRPWFYQRLGNSIARREPGTVVPVAFFNTGFGGSGIDNWYDSMKRTQEMFSGGYQQVMVPGTTAYQCVPYFNECVDSQFDNRYPYINLKNVLSFYGNVFGARAVLWHQGEADSYILKEKANGNPKWSAYDIAPYSNKLTALINDTRSYLPNLPWAVCKVSLFSDGAGSNYTNSSVVQEHAETQQTTANVSWASQNSDTYTAPSFRDAGDRTHFNEAGLKAIADEIYSNIGSIIAKAPISPKPALTINYTGKNASNAYTFAISDVMPFYSWPAVTIINQLPDLNQVAGFSSANTTATTNSRTMSYAKDGFGNYNLSAILTTSLSGARLAAVEEEVSATESNVYPNPVGAGKSFRIEYVLAEEANVTLQLINESGQLVTTLVDELQPARTYSVEVSGATVDKAFQTLYYKLTVNNKVVTRRILFVK